MNCRLTQNLLVPVGSPERKREARLRLKLKVVPGLYAVCRLAPDSDIPAWFKPGEFGSITWTLDELSIVCVQTLVPDVLKSERDWSCLMVQGPLDLGLTGILLMIAEPLAQAKISIFAVSTYDTDYVLVKHDALDVAIRVLRESGHTVLKS